MGHGIWKKHSQKKNKKIGGGSHDNWKKHQKTHKKVETVPAPAPTPKQAYGAGAGGDWTVEVKTIHHSKKQETLEDQVARQNNWYKDGPVKNLSKAHHHGKVKTGPN